MSFHRVCCCSPSPCVCTGCDFASSYLMSCVTVSGSWNHVAKYKDLCTTPCFTNDEEPYSHDVDVVVSLTIPSGTLTRFGSGSACCYRRNGTATVTYTVTITTHYACLMQQPCTTCHETVSWSGTVDVDFCHVVNPVCIGGTLCSWSHTFSTCSVDIGYHWWVPGIGPADCSGGINCDEPPLVETRFVLGGVIAQWTTAYVALDSLKEADFSWVGFCPQYPWGCNATPTETDQDGDTQCMEYTAFDVTNGGPFALLGSSSPDTQCLDPTTVIFNSWTNCDPAPYPIRPCYGQGDYQTDCCGNEFNFSAAPPCYS